MNQNEQKVWLDYETASGYRIQIVDGFKTSVPNGHHLIVSCMEGAGDPSDEDFGNICARIRRFMREEFAEEAGKEFTGDSDNYRIGYNAPGLRGGRSKGFHMHIIIPGEGDIVPRLVDRVESVSEDKSKMVLTK